MLPLHVRRRIDREGNPKTAVPCVPHQYKSRVIIRKPYGWIIDCQTSVYLAQFVGLLLEVLGNIRSHRKIHFGVHLRSSDALEQLSAKENPSLSDLSTDRKLAKLAVAAWYYRRIIETKKSNVRKTES